MPKAKWRLLNAQDSSKNKSGVYGVALRLFDSHLASAPYTCGMETTLRQQFLQWIHSEPARQYWLRDAPQWSDQSLARLLQAVDDSDCALDDWLRALLEIELWLQRENRSLKRENRVAYIACAASVADHFSDLASLVADFLDAYGCDQASPSQA